MQTLSEHTNTLLGIFPRKIEELKKDGLYRSFVPFSHLAAERGQATHDADRVQVWCSNDYLGLSQHPEVIRAQLDSTAEHGTGSGGSRNIAGTSAAHVELETRLAAWHGKERALVFSSGYVANFETLSTVISALPDIVVFSDAKNHRSLIEGILRTRCAKHIFPHNDLDELEKALAQYDHDRPKLIVFESIYSMDGDVSPVRAICDLADKYNALTFVDETHAVGTRGPTGAGVCEEAGENRPTFVQGVFSKAFGTVGGYVAGPDGALDYVRSHAPGFIFTTSLPHSNLDATLRSLELIQNGDALRQALADNVRHLKQALSTAGIGFLDADSHLVPVLVPGAERVRRVARVLFEEHDIYVTPINFPSVPRGAERFRITVPPFRTPAQIDDFVSALRKSLDS
ncbi:5-aminolevulinate synthase [Streptosporangium algeriense]|uniref:8-amino-7-oxononanoate synthase n=1 Tax=Streptosporangium algeriense TaxID=1682748 RepID=A0ABW3DJS7_9ACTN